VNLSVFSLFSLFSLLKQPRSLALQAKSCQGQSGGQADEGLCRLINHLRKSGLARPTKSDIDTIPIAQ
jgi:hypothetical protein